MAFLKYTPLAIHALFIACAFVAYSITGAGGVLLLALGIGYVLGTWISNLLEPKLAHVELRRRLRRSQAQHWKK